MEELFSREIIARRVEELGGEISRFYEGKDLTVIVLMNGGAFFGCDLVRAVSIPMWFDSMRTASYVNDVRSGKVILASELKLPVKDREVLLVDDVFDSGETVKYCRKHLLSLGAKSVRCAVLMNKKLPGRDGEPDWACFTAPDRYLIGMGMDSHELYRNLPLVAAMDK